MKNPDFKEQNCHFSPFFFFGGGVDLDFVRISIIFEQLQIHGLKMHEFAFLAPHLNLKLRRLDQGFDPLPVSARATSPKGGGTLDDWIGKL